MIEVIITGLSAVTVLYGYILYKHLFQNKKKKDWPDAHTIKLVESDTANIIYQRTLFFFDTQHAREYAFAHFKSFYEDKNYEVVIEHD